MNNSNQNNITGRRNATAATVTLFGNSGNRQSSSVNPNLSLMISENSSLSIASMEQAEQFISISESNTDTRDEDRCTKNNFSGG